MSLKLVAVDGFSIEISDPLVSATITRTGLPSTKCRAGGSGIVKDGFGVSVSAITKPPATIPDPGPYSASFSASASKARADGALVLRVDDETGTINATPQIPGTPPTPSPVSFTLKISAAGQDKTRAQ